MKTLSILMAVLVGACVLLATTGCDEELVAPIQPYLRSDQSVLRLHRTVFISMDNQQGSPKTAEGMTEALVDAIQQRKLFHIDVVSAIDPACRDLPLDQREAMSMQDLSEIRDALKCDAVIFGRVTRWQTYPRMKIGIYLKLIDLKNGLPVWVVDHTWDSTDSQTEKRIKNFFTQEMRSGYDPIQWRLAMMSPKVFQKFVAYETANTLPTRTPPAEKPFRIPVLSDIPFKRIANTKTAE